ncbi:MAG: HAMP domain-containing protein [Akkermansiaceae bacterium]|nr:HAMP domain-containing protein [Armatimonadota bacterium]
MNDWGSISLPRLLLRYDSCLQYTMRRSLRTELLFSHLVLVALMLMVLLASVGGFFRLGGYVDRILRDNYKSVVAAQAMKDALERQDSAATFHLAGQRDKARAQYAMNRARFEKALAEESGNVTEPGEQELVDEIRVRYAPYRKHLDQLFRGEMDNNAARGFYFRTLENDFLRLKETAQGILDLNQRAIVAADKEARAEANRSAILTAVVAVGAGLLAVVLTYRTVNSLMTPIVSLTRQAEEVGVGHLNQHIDVRREDEIGLLAGAFNEMAERLNDARRREEDRLRVAERMSDAALSYLYDPVIVSDAAGRVVHLNRAAEGLFGPDSAAKGRDVGLVVRNKRLYDALLRAIGTQETSADEGDAALTTLGGRTYRLRATPMRDGAENKPLGAVAVLEDVTHQEEVNRLKTEFIGVASHELRTPVTSMLLGVELLTEGAAGELSPAQQEVVFALRSDLERLQAMMHDLLDMTRLQAGTTPPRLEIVPVAEIVQSARQSVERQAAAKGVLLQTVATPRMPPLRADRGQVGRVLVNLLNNAIRHTESGGTVRYGAEVGDDDMARFFVADTGTGIAPEYLETIFERFVQVPGATKGGAGLGLSVAQSIVRAHGGEIRAESKVGTGSTFSFTIPTIVSREKE